MKYSSLVIFSLIFSCTNSYETKFHIFKLNSISYVDTTNSKNKIKSDYFVISGFKNHEESQSLVDEFITEEKNNFSIKFHQYNMIFYKLSEFTNIENVITNPKIIDRYSQNHDLIYSYSWVNGTLVSVMKYKEGKLLNE